MADSILKNILSQYNQKKIIKPKIEIPAVEDKQPEPVVQPETIESEPENGLLSKSVDILVNNSDAFKPDDLSEIRDNLIVLAAAKSAGITNDSVSTFLSSTNLSEKISSAETEDIQAEDWKTVIWT